ncbi:hypothetical protein [Streptomyces sp. SYSU K217416]
MGESGSVRPDQLRAPAGRLGLHHVVQLVALGGRAYVDAVAAVRPVVPHHRGRSPARPTAAGKLLAGRADRPSAPTGAHAGAVHRRSLGERSGTLSGGDR